jgi:methyl-accepting chemotaxis protein
MAVRTKPLDSFVPDFAKVAIMRAMLQDLRIGSNDLGSRLPEAGNSDEISRLSRTFNHMLDRVQASVNQVRTVTDYVAHDLKSLVTWIRGRLEA